MPTVTVDEAKVRLTQLIAGLLPGESVQLTDGTRPVARLIAEPAIAQPSRRPGSAIGRLVVISDDDDHLKDFHEYMS